MLRGTAPDRSVATGARGPVERLQSRESEFARLMRAAIERHFGKPSLTAHLIVLGSHVTISGKTEIANIRPIIITI